MDQGGGLESKVYNCAMQALPKAKEEVSKLLQMAVPARYIVFPFLCEGVVDELTYDRQEGRFIKITYYVGVGKSILGFFEKREKREILLDGK